MKRVVAALIIFFFFVPKEVTCDCLLSGCSLSPDRSWACATLRTHPSFGEKSDVYRQCCQFKLVSKVNCEGYQGSPRVTCAVCERKWTGYNPGLERACTEDREDNLRMMKRQGYTQCYGRQPDFPCGNPALRLGCWDSVFGSNNCQYSYAARSETPLEEMVYHWFNKTYIVGQEALI